MNNDIRNLSKWLNEEQETPIDRQALARVLAMAEQPAPMIRGDIRDGLVDDEPAQSSKPFDTHAAPGQSFDTHSRTPQQEPVAWTVAGQVRDWSKDFSAYQTKHYVRPLYTSPPAQRKPLTDAQIKTRTDEQIEATFKRCGGRWNGDHWVIEDADLHPFVRTIEGPELNTLRAISDEYNAWIKHHAAGHSYDDFLAKREAANGVKGDT